VEEGWWGRWSSEGPRVQCASHGTAWEQEQEQVQEQEHGAMQSAPNGSRWHPPQAAAVVILCSSRWYHGGGWGGHCTIWPQGVSTEGNQMISATTPLQRMVLPMVLPIILPMVLPIILPPFAVASLHRARAMAEAAAAGAAATTRGAMQHRHQHLQEQQQQQQEQLSCISALRRVCGRRGRASGLKHV
jgi:hypothetical protein